MSNSLLPHGLVSPWNSPVQNTGLGSLFLLQRIFPNQGLSWGILHCRRILYQLNHSSIQFCSVAQSCPTFCNPMDFSTPSLPVHPNSWSLLKLLSIELVMPSNHLILCHLLLLPSIFPNIRVFSNDSALHIRWPKYWTFISASAFSEYS